MKRFVLLWSFALAGASMAAQVTSEGLEFFESKIRPVLVEQCYRCHSAQSEKLKGELFLDTAAGMMKGGKSGQAAIMPGDVTRSLLLSAISYTNSDLQMPPK